MSLLHALVARDDTILAECDKSSGQYSNACQAILSKIPPNDSKLTYAADQILIHYQKKDNVTALVVAEDTAGRRVPFSFLAELHRKFTASFNANEIADSVAYGLNSFEKEIAALMRQYEENPPQDAIKAAQAELAATKDVMVKSIDAVLSRGERIEILVDRTDEMSHQARAFRKRATVVRRKMWFKNVKVLFAVGFSAVLLVYLLSASVCGVGLSHCRS
ncbi:hypothetical protein BMF94_1045 [Rhodotorula taiwanensis]|uniref:Synaptobrevin homolog YKT6 n=1 Tax=Rhodotorula taiwanensis TaxID=741276 RepID=A0A2S5BGR6_9BASI|nr:hypothetical protein BMF94_1045 [Rhodotorula taiwanensis]